MLDESSAGLSILLNEQYGLVDAPSMKAAETLVHLLKNRNATVELLPTNPSAPPWADWVWHRPGDRNSM